MRVQANAAFKWAALWPPPKIHDPPVCVHNTGKPTASYITDEHWQPFPSDEVLCRDPEYSWDQYIQS